MSSNEEKENDSEGEKKYKQHLKKEKFKQMQNMIDDHADYLEDIFFIKVGDYIGEGAFGYVYTGFDYKTNDECAIKIIKKSNNNSYEIETRIIAELKHKNIVRFRRVCETKQLIYLVMDYLKGGTLQDLINERKQKNQQFTEDEMGQIMDGILDGIKHMHDNQVIHRDIKPANILLKDKNDLNTICISDFGLSVQYTGGELTSKIFSQKCGTLLYMAPEQIIDGYYSKSVDIWSSGIVFYNLFWLGKHPFYEKGMKKEDFVRHFRQGIDWDYPQNLSKQGIQFFKKLVCKDPKGRYNADQALLHPFVTRNPNGEVPITAYERRMIFQDYIKVGQLMKKLYFVKFLQSWGQKDSKRQLKYKQLVKTDSQNSLYNKQVVTIQPKYSNEEKQQQQKQKDQPQIYNKRRTSTLGSVKLSQKNEQTPKNLGTSISDSQFFCNESIQKQNAKTVQLNNNNSSRLYQKIDKKGFYQPLLKNKSNSQDKQLKSNKSALNHSSNSNSNQEISSNKNKLYSTTKSLNTQKSNSQQKINLRTRNISTKYRTQETEKSIGNESTQSIQFESENSMYNTMNNKVSQNQSKQSNYQNQPLLRKPPSGVSQKLITNKQNIQQLNKCQTENSNTLLSPCKEKLVKRVENNIKYKQSPQSQRFGQASSFSPNLREKNMQIVQNIQSKQQNRIPKEFKKQNNGENTPLSNRSDKQRNSLEKEKQIFLKCYREEKKRLAAQQKGVDGQNNQINSRENSLEKLEMQRQKSYEKIKKQVAKINEEKKKEEEEKSKSKSLPKYIPQNSSVNHSLANTRKKKLSETQNLKNKITDNNKNQQNQEQFSNFQGQIGNQSNIIQSPLTRISIQGSQIQTNVQSKKQNSNNFKNNQCLSGQSSTKSSNGRTIVIPKNAISPSNKQIQLNLQKNQQNQNLNQKVANSQYFQMNGYNNQKRKNSDTNDKQFQTSFTSQMSQVSQSTHLPPLAPKSCKNNQRYQDGSNY